MNEVLDPEIVEDDESSLRPSDFDEYIGQTNLKENLKVFVGAAKLRDESLDHVWTTRFRKNNYVNDHCSWNGDAY